MISFLQHHIHFYVHVNFISIWLQSWYIKSIIILNLYLEIILIIKYILYIWCPAKPPAWQTCVRQQALFVCTMYSVHKNCQGERETLSLWKLRMPGSAGKRDRIASLALGPLGPPAEATRLSLTSWINKASGKRAKDRWAQIQEHNGEKADYARQICKMSHTRHGRDVASRLANNKCTGIIYIYIYTFQRLRSHARWSAFVMSTSCSTSSRQ